MFAKLPSLSARFLIGYVFVSRDNLQIKCTFILGVPPTHVEYLRFAIGVPLTFFRVDSVTLNIPHTTEKSDTIIFRSTKIIGTLPRIVRRGEIGPIILWCVPSIFSQSHGSNSMHLGIYMW